MSKGKFALGALIGAAVGVVAGVLTAPKSGKETRADLKVKADEAKQKANQAVADVKAKGQQVYNDMRAKADTAMGDAQESMTDYSDRVKRAAASAKKELDREHNNGKNGNSKQ